MELNVGKGTQNQQPKDRGAVPTGFAPVRPRRWKRWVEELMALVDDGGK